MTWRTQANAIVRICYFHGILGLVRSPVFFVAIFLTPLSFLFFLYVVAPHAVLPFGVIGGLLFSALFTGNGMMTDCAYLRLERQLQQVFITSPLRPISWVLGMALAELAFTVPALALFLVVLALVVPVSGPTVLALIGVILLTWLLATSLGFLLSTFFHTLREIWPVGMVVFTALSVLPPVFYPITAIPASDRWVAYLSPSTFASQLAARAAGLPVPGISVVPALSSVPVEVVCLVALTGLFTFLAMRLARWREP
ncbi:MAG TPA: ABC transporter permease [Thermoplasmata archaeon]|nr:ABC transporter permease [Thermoplasmata archaeon]